MKRYTMPDTLHALVPSEEGEWVHRDDIEDLINAHAELKQKHARVLADMAGAMAELRALRAKVKGLGL